MLSPQDLTIYQFCDAEPNCSTGYNRARIGWSLHASFFDVAYEYAGTGTGKILRLGKGFQNIQIQNLVIPVWEGASNPLYQFGAATQVWGPEYWSGPDSGGYKKSLTDAGAAVAIVNAAIADGKYGGGEIMWAAVSTDAADYRVTEGRVRYAGVNKGGTMTCPNPTAVGTDLTASSNANTLVCTWTGAAGTASCDIKVTCTDNTAGSQTMAIYYRVSTPLGTGDMASSYITFPGATIP